MLATGADLCSKVGLICSDKQRAQFLQRLRPHSRDVREAIDRFERSVDISKLDDAARQCWTYFGQCLQLACGRSIDVQLKLRRWQIGVYYGRPC